MRGRAKEKKEYLDKERRYCFVCDTEITKVTLELESVAKRDKDLRSFLSKDNYWMIEHIAIIARKFAKQFVCTAK